MKKSVDVKAILDRLGHEELELKKLGMVNHANGVRIAIVQVLKLTDESEPPMPGAAPIGIS